MASFFSLCSAFRWLNTLTIVSPCLSCSSPMRFSSLTKVCLSVSWPFCVLVINFKVRYTWVVPLYLAHDENRKSQQQSCVSLYLVHRQNGYIYMYLQRSVSLYLVHRQCGYIYMYLQRSVSL